MRTQPNPCSEDLRPQTVEACALFVVLMHADDQGALEDVVEAQRRLDGLGVRVRFPRYHGQPEGEAP